MSHAEIVDVHSHTKMAPPVPRVKTQESGTTSGMTAITPHGTARATFGLGAARAVGAELGRLGSAALD